MQLGTRVNRINVEAIPLSYVRAFWLYCSYSERQQRQGEIEEITCSKGPQAELKPRPVRERLRLEDMLSTRWATMPPPQRRARYLNILTYRQSNLCKHCLWENVLSFLLFGAFNCSDFFFKSDITAVRQDYTSCLCKTNALIKISMTSQHKCLRGACLWSENVRTCS